MLSSEQGRRRFDLISEGLGGEAGRDPLRPQGQYPSSFPRQVSSEARGMVPLLRTRAWGWGKKGPRGHLGSTRKGTCYTIRGDCVGQNPKDWCTWNLGM